MHHRWAKEVPSNGIRNPAYPSCGTDPESKRAIGQKNRVNLGMGLWPEDSVHQRFGLLLPESKTGTPGFLHLASNCLIATLKSPPEMIYFKLEEIRIRLFILICNSDSKTIDLRPACAKRFGEGRH